MSHSLRVMSIAILSLIWIDSYPWSSGFIYLIVCVVLFAGDRRMPKTVTVFIQILHPCPDPVTNLLVLSGSRITAQRTWWLSDSRPCTSIVQHCQSQFDTV